MNQELLDLLQGLMLVADGAGIYASLDRMLYYRKGRTNPGVYPIYIHFWVLFVVYLLITFSDACVIFKWPLWWATLPIIRGHVVRTPITLVLLWSIQYQHHADK